MKDNKRETEQEIEGGRNLIIIAVLIGVPLCGLLLGLFWQYAFSH